MSTDKTIRLTGRIDSNNSDEVLSKILEELGDGECSRVILDAADLVYISSAGLRMILKLKKKYGVITVMNVSPQVYEIFDSTGFTQMMEVEKAYREISVEGCQEIGWGAHSKIYRLDNENVVKVYSVVDGLEQIKHEREVAKLALILGIPTAISFEIVKVGKYYGSIFELLNADSFSHILATQPERLEWCARESVAILKKIHDITVPEGKLPNMKDTAMRWVEDLKDQLPEGATAKLIALIKAVPDDDHLVHGDYHTKNIMVQGDEILIIDMDTLSRGHPIFELSSMFNSYIGFSEYNHEHVVEFQGYDFETSKEFWRRSLAIYLGTDDENRIDEVDQKARIIGYARMIRYVIKHKKENDPSRTEYVKLWKDRLLECLDNVDTLLF